MNTHEQRMCELQGDLFELSSSRFSCGSSIFISRFMYSDLAKELDNIDDPYNFISPNNMISIMAEKYPSLNEKGGNKYPKEVLRWIGYIYRAYSIIKKQYSYKIYRLLKAEKLLPLYDSFHTFSPEYCVERLDEIIQQNNPSSIEDEYMIFKSIMMNN